VDAELNEFWEGDPWAIFDKHNLSCFERNRMYLNSAGQGFLDVSFVSGADNDGDSRSAIAADLNGDGMLDLVVRQAGGGPLLIYENQLPPRHYLTVSLRGTKSNRLGVGARLTAFVGDRQIVRENYPANTYRSQSPSLVSFGLGDHARVDRLEITWPSGLKQELRDLPADSHIVVTEGQDHFQVAKGGVVSEP